VTAANVRWMAWCGPVAIVILLLGQWGIAGFVPPPGDDSLDKIVSIYVADQDRIRIGLIIACAGVTLFAPWTVAIAIQMKRIEGNLAPLAWLQLMLGAILLVEFYIPSVVWEVAAFRPAMDPELTFRLHDLGSVLFVALPFTAALQAVALGIAILQDKTVPTVFPRWLAYLSFWAAIGFLPGALNPLAHSGPVAWDGILAWWLGLSIFGVWIVAVSVCLLRPQNASA
jgi:hypothetical protein